MRPTAYQLVAISLGVLAVLVALGLRMRSRRSAASKLRQALVDPDPATRRAAVFVASEERLTSYLDVLIERTRHETDARVLDALADVVLRNQWAAAESHQLIELRLWAQSYMEAKASRTQPARKQTLRAELDALEAMGEPVRQAAPPLTNQPPEPPPVADAAFAPAPSEPPGSPGVSVTWGDTGDGDIQHRPMRWAPGTIGRGAIRPGLSSVIVTGAGGAAGVSVIRSLVAAGHRVIAVDMDGMAPGLRLAHEAALVPSGDDATFVATLCQLARATSADLLVSTVSEELVAIAEGAEELEDAGLALWVPEPSAVSTCIDKWRLSQELSENGLPTPDTNLGSGDRVPGAWVVKPRFGRGSRDVHFVDRQAGLQAALVQVPNPIVQTRLSGREFTVDTLVDRNGDLVAAVPRWRIETKAGISTKGRTFVHKELVDLVADVLSALNLRGPANVQGFMTLDGTPSFIDVNPRFSGGLPLSMAAGADLVGEYVRAILGEPIRADRLTFRPGVTMIRYLEEIFE